VAATGDGWTPESIRIMVEQVVRAETQRELNRLIQPHLDFLQQATATLKEVVDGN
jgi:hypothetical protein